MTNHTPLTRNVVEKTTGAGKPRKSDTLSTIHSTMESILVIARGKSMSILQHWLLVFQHYTQDFFVNELFILKSKRHKWAENLNHN